MKKFAKVLCVCLLVFCVISMVSCNKKTETRSVTSTEKLTIWVYDEGRVGILTNLGKKFEAEYGIAVEVSMVDLGQIRNQILLASGGAECADIVIIPHDNLGPMVENGAVIEINLGGKRGSFLQPSIDGFTYNGKLYGLPMAVENIAFFYNTALVPTPPKTWAEAVSIAEELKRQGKIDYMFGCPDATYNVYPVYDSFGGTIFGKNADGSLNGKQVLMAESGFVAGLEFLANQVQRGLIPQTIDWDGAHVLFESGRAPFCPTGPWALNRFQEAGVPYAIASFPAATAGGPAGNPFMGVQGMVISSASPRRVLAQAFVVDFLASEANFRAIFEVEQRPSAWITVFNSANDADSRAFNAAGISAIPMPSIPEMGYVWDAWVAAAELAFSGARTPAQALQTAKTQIESMGQ